MRALLILGLCATAMVANARTAKTDTVNRYIINGQTISNFNGTQLQGKTVTSYNVATQNEKNRVVVTHNITTDGAKQNPAPSSNQNQKPSPMFKFEVKGNDGVSYVTEADMLKIVDGVVVDELPGPGNYISAKAWGPGSPEAKEFGEIGKNGVVIVRTKQIPTKINSVYSDQLNMVIIDKDDSGKLPFKVIYSKNVAYEASFGGRCIRFEFGENNRDKLFDVVVIPGAFDDYVLYVDGEKSATMPAANNIYTIETFAPGTEKAKAYASDGKGAVHIDTKANKKIYVIDGKVVTIADMKLLDNRKIKSVEVLKGESAKGYTDDPNVGVFIVKTK